ncbi:MAG: glycosyltransferase, partial [Pseudomonadota bacterium]
VSNYSVVQAKQDLFLVSTGFSRQAFRKFPKLVAQADIIHYHFPNPFADLLHFASKVNKPSVITYHSDIIKQKYLGKLYKPLMLKFLDSVDRIIATSPNYLHTSDVLMRYQDKVSVIPIGFEKQSLPSVTANRLAYWKNRLPKHFFLFIGAMRYYKGLHIALDAIKGTDLQIVLAGIGPLEHELKRRAKKEHIDNLVFLGRISEQDKVAIQQLSYAFVFPSHLRTEAFGVSLVEAAAFSKPLISCEIGTGTTFINVDHVTGLVIPHSSPDALRSAMYWLLANPEKAKEFGQNAAIRHEQFFTANKQALAYVELYKSMRG